MTMLYLFIYLFFRQLHNASQLAHFCEKFLSVHYREVQQKHSKMFRSLPKEKQEVVEKTRWPPIWYVVYRVMYSFSLSLSLSVPLLFQRIFFCLWLFVFLLLFVGALSSIIISHRGLLFFSKIEMGIYLCLV